MTAGGPGEDAPPDGAPAPGAGGEDAPEDDASVTDETQLFRRVPPTHYKCVDGEFVVREGAFKNFPNPERRRMSVALGDTLEDLGQGPEDVLEGYEGYGLVVLRAGYVRNDEDQRLERSPREGDDAHGDVYGDKPPSRRKRFVDQATWVIRPSVENGEDERLTG